MWLINQLIKRLTGEAYRPAFNVCLYDATVGAAIMLGATGHENADEYI